MKVKYFMIPYSKIVTCDISTNIEQVTSILLSKGVGSIIVTKKNVSNHLIATGIITKTDLLISFLQKKGSSATASEVMSTNVILCHEEDEREKAAQIMIDFNVHHILVQNDKKEIVGITSSLDLAREMVDDSQDSFPYFRKLFGISNIQIERFTYVLEKKIETGIESFEKVFPEQPLYSPDLL